MGDVSLHPPVKAEPAAHAIAQVTFTSSSFLLLPIGFRF
jgi:hypothetical protein